MKALISSIKEKNDCWMSNYEGDVSIAINYGFYNFQLFVKLPCKPQSFFVNYYESVQCVSLV